MCLINYEPLREDLWGSGGIVSLFLASTLDGDEWSASRLGLFNPGERAPASHWTEAGWAPCWSGLSGGDKISCFY
jgi:hypothetical protein